METENLTAPAETETVDPRVEALADFLNCDPSEIEEDRHTDNAFNCGRAEYLVLTDEESDDLCKAQIEESLWAFNTDFLLRYIPGDFSPAAIKAFQRLQGELCEGANDLIAAMLGSKYAMAVSDAMHIDGRGHFLAQYDGEENEENGFYIYRVS